jgi:hypothetical protein
MLMVTDVAFLVAQDSVTVVDVVQLTWLGAENDAMAVAVLADCPPLDPDEPPPPVPPPLLVVVVDDVEVLVLLPPPHAAAPRLTATSTVRTAVIPHVRIWPGWTNSVAPARMSGSQIRRYRATASGTKTTRMRPVQTTICHSQW